MSNRISFDRLPEYLEECGSEFKPSSSSKGDDSSDAEDLISNDEDFFDHHWYSLKVKPTGGIGLAFSLKVY